MKLHTRLIAALLAALVLSGCFGVCFAAQAKKADDNTYLSYYADVIKNYKAVIKKNYYRGGEMPTMYEMPKYVSWPLVDYWKNYFDTTDTVYYALHDINGNGFPELLIGARPDYGENEWMLYGVFSYTDRIQRVAVSTEWGYAVTGCVFKNGTVSESISGGFNNSYWRFYKLNKQDQPKYVEQVSWNGWNGDKYFRGKKEETEITKQTAEKICNSYTGQGMDFYYKPDVKFNWKKIVDLPKISGVAKPKNVKVAAENTTALKLQWNAVKGAQGYAVYRYDDAAKKYVLLKTVDGTSAKVRNLQSGTSYRFAVRAFTKPAEKRLYSGFSKLTAKTAR